MARFGPRADRAADFRPGPGRANLQAQNRAKMGRRALTGPWKTGPGRAKTGRATARHKPRLNANVSLKKQTKKTTILLDFQTKFLKANNPEKIAM